MSATYEVITVAHAVQQSVAPVFLITGVGSILSVLSSRLARVIDRFRILDESEEKLSQDKISEMMTLIQRSRWIHWAITLCTTSALLICIVIAALFIGSELNKDPSGAISIFFSTAMLTLTGGLVCFLREISLSMGVIKIR
jgi:hypothetical protein